MYVGVKEYSVGVKKFFLEVQRKKYSVGVKYCSVRTKEFSVGN